MGAGSVLVVLTFISASNQYYQHGQEEEDKEHFHDFDSYCHNLVGAIQDDHVNQSSHVAEPNTREE